MPLAAAIIEKQNALNFASFLGKIVNINFTYNEVIYLGIFFLICSYSLKTIYQIYFYYFKSRFIKDINYCLNQELFNYYIFYDYKDFIKNKSTPEILRNLISEVAGFVSRSFNPFVLLTLDFLLIFISIVFLLFINFNGTIFCIILLSLFLFFFYKNTKKYLSNWGQRRQELELIKNKSIHETFESLKEIKLMRLENRRINEFDLINKEMNTVVSKEQFLQDLPKVVMEFFIIIIFSSFIFFMIIIDFDSKKILNIIAIYVLVALKFLPSLPRIINSIQSLKYGYPSMRVIYDELQSIEINNKRRLVKKFSKIESGQIQKIELNNVSYGYNKNNKEIIQDFSKTFSIGKKYFIKGKSGVGKTTLLDLISGLIEPLKGDIKIEGINLAEIKDLNNLISYVPQSVSIFDDTIKNNIVFDKTYDPKFFDEIIRICSLNDLLNKIDNSDNPFLGQSGKKISGGEKQRIGIARALYKDAPILIFDEATNSLDIERESKILEFIFNKKNKIFIFTSHKQMHNVYNFETINL